MTAWNDFVKNIYHAGKKINKDYSFKDALKDASKRKAEMGSSASSSKKSAKNKKGGTIYGSSLNPASLPVSPQYDGIDGQGITKGVGQSGPLTAALTASGGGKRKGRKTKRNTKRKGRKSRKTRRH